MVGHVVHEDAPALALKESAAHAVHVPAAPAVPAAQGANCGAKMALRKALPAPGVAEGSSPLSQQQAPAAELAQHEPVEET